MFIKSNLNDLIVWRAYLVNSNSRFWNPYNFLYLSGSDNNNSIVDLRYISKQLDRALSLTALIFNKGGKAWFYNVFFSMKKYIIDKFTANYKLIKRRTRFSFGLSLNKWWPGRLSNHKFVKKCLKIVRKVSFKKRLSRRRRFYRYRTSKPLIGKTRAKRRRKPRHKLKYIKKIRYYSRRKGFSRKRLKLALIRTYTHKKLKLIRHPFFKAFKKKYYFSLKGRHSEMKKLVKFLKIGRNKEKPFKGLPVSSLRKKLKLLKRLKRKKKVKRYKRFKPKKRRKSYRQLRSDRETYFEVKTQRYYPPRYYSFKYKKFQLKHKKSLKPKRKKNLIKYKKFIKYKKKKKILKPKKTRYLSWLYFSDNFSLFFEKPSLSRVYKIDRKFKPEEDPFVDIYTLTPGTPENPAALPVVDMPTRNPRRIALKKFKVYKKLVNRFNSKSGEIFYTLLTDFSDKIEKKSKILYNLRHHNLTVPRYQVLKLLTSRIFRKRLKRKIRRLKFRKGKRLLEIFHKKKLNRFKIKLKASFNFRQKIQKKLYQFVYQKLVLSNKKFRLMKGLSMFFLNGYNTLVRPSVLPFRVFSLNKFKKKLKRFFFKFINLKKNPETPKSFLNLNYRRFSLRNRKRRYFKRLKLKAKKAKIVQYEKVFKTLNKRRFKRRKFIPFKKLKALTNLAYSGVSSVKFKFNLPLIKKKARLYSERYLKVNKKFYTIKNRPLHSVLFKKLKKKYLSVKFKKKKRTLFASNRKISLPLQDVENFKNKLNINKVKRIGYNSLYKPKFIIRKKYKKYFRRLKRHKKRFKTLKRISRPFRVFPSVFFVGRLTRLTFSILNETKSAGVLLFYFNNGECSSNYNDFSILMNDSLSSLHGLKNVIQSVFEYSKILNILNRFIF